ncbi:MAG: ribosome silencing factor [Defluviitaleaceae bacterium]|nr:ribosome silencing factor [Defluviitaleaceae bacterium]
MEVKNMEKEKIFQGVKAAYKAVDDKQGEDIMVLDITTISPLADYFIIASASNSNLLKALAESVDEALAPHGIHTRHVEGTQSARWILMDFGSIIVHLFHREEREFYRLEKLWGDARHLMEEELI